MHRYSENLRVTAVKYKLLSIILAGALVAVALGENDTFQGFLTHLGSYSYLGAFLAGLLFVSTVTVPTSIVVITLLAQNMNPVVLGLIGGFGAVIGDLVVFKLVKDHMADELMILFGSGGSSYVRTVLKSKYVAWTLPVIGMFIIASPLPDEIGLSLLGVAKMSDTKLVLISYVSNALGIIGIASVMKAF